MAYARDRGLICESGHVVNEYSTYDSYRELNPTSARSAERAPSASAGTARRPSTAEGAKSIGRIDSPWRPRLQKTCYSARANDRTGVVSPIDSTRN